MSGRAPGNVTNNGIVSEIAGSTVVRRNDLWGATCRPI